MLSKANSGTLLTEVHTLLTFSLFLPNVLFMYYSLIQDTMLHLVVVSWCIHAAQLLQLCPTLCDHMDCSPPDFSVHGILQARILEWVAIPDRKSVV